MSKKVFLTAIIFCATVAQAADPSETGVPTSPLKIYSGGFGSGASMALNDELQDISKQFLRLSLINTFTFRDNLAMFLDIDWLLPKKNGGADLGIDFLFLPSDFRPFAGIGCGVKYIDRDDDFGNTFGPAFTAHVGFIFDLTNNVAVRVRLPYHYILNEYRDQTVGLEIGFLFSNRFKNVRKLEYNR